MASGRPIFLGYHPSQFSIPIGYSNMCAGELAHTPRKLWNMIQPIWNSRTNEAVIPVRRKSIRLSRCTLHCDFDCWTWSYDHRLVIDWIILHEVSMHVAFRWGMYNVILPGSALIRMRKRIFSTTGSFVLHEWTSFGPYPHVGVALHQSKMPTATIIRWRWSNWKW